MTKILLLTKLYSDSSEPSAPLGLTLGFHLCFCGVYFEESCYVSLARVLTLNIWSPLISVQISCSLPPPQEISDHPGLPSASILLGQFVKELSYALSNFLSMDCPLPHGYKSPLLVFELSPVCLPYCNTPLYSSCLS